MHVEFKSWQLYMGFNLEFDIEEEAAGGGLITLTLYITAPSAHTSLL